MALRRFRRMSPYLCALLLVVYLLLLSTRKRSIPERDNVLETPLPLISGRNSDVFAPRAASAVEGLAADDTAEAQDYHLQTQTLRPSDPASCDELPCRSPMEPIDRGRYETCIRTSLGRLRERGFKITSRSDLSRTSCRLLTNSSRLPVFLASAPGSGNTWLRALLENVTELCTGSVYCDEELRAQHFEAEGIESGSVLVVKTHEPAPSWSWGPSYDTNKNATLFGSGILLVRNPLRCLAAHRKWFLAANTNLSAHTAELEITQDLKWTDFIYENMKRWVAMFRHVLTSTAEHPVLLVSYEDLAQDTVAQVKRVLAFLGVGYDGGELDRRLSWNFMTKFQRQRTTTDNSRQPFTAWQLDAVRKHVRLTMQLLEKYPHALQVVRKYYERV